MLANVTSDTLYGRELQILKGTFLYLVKLKLHLTEIQDGVSHLRMAFDLQIECYLRKLINE
jgi:hypothetical protein